MKCEQALLVKPRKFSFREINLEPSRGELLIKVKVCGLCKWELNHWKGQMGDCPMTLGHEVAGTVAEVGAEVTGFEIGNRVASLVSKLAGFAEYCTLPRSRSPQRDAPGLAATRCQSAQN